MNESTTIIRKSRSKQLQHWPANNDQMLHTCWNIMSCMFPFFTKTYCAFHIFLHNKLNPKGKTITPFGEFSQNNSFTNLQDEQYKLSNNQTCKASNNNDIRSNT